MSTTPTPPVTPSLDVLRAEAERLALPLDAEALVRFARYQALLSEWHDRAGLTAITDPAEVQRRHFGESLALFAALRSADILLPGAETHIADLGTGAGFPGLPMRIADPSLQLTLIESNGRRCRFLEAVVADLGLDHVEVVNLRAEEAGRAPALREHFEVVVARALSAMNVLVEYALPLLRDGGLLATPKGSRALDELAEAAPAIAALGGTALGPLTLPQPADAPPQHVLLVRRTGTLDDRYPRRPGIPTRRPLT